MRVKIKTCLAGDRVVLKPGDVVEVGEEEAERLLAAGFAERVAGRPKIEVTARLGGPERADRSERETRAEE